ncbi:DUF6443 domain-containing protein [Chryseobacterium sp. c4a]|uniref:DUF6443 domain-containing protein n=1 Tax=Chryseobacterium sp. c4a TaxID=1573582 RepID=UPI00135CA96E|nr:DUF6443 domain-containing protein [Chryseobacterium sp. c4a]
MIRALIVGLFISGIYCAQTNTETYKQTRTYLEPVTTTKSDAKQLRNVEYFDGLGRPKQIITVKSSPQGKDVVSHIEYDQFGRLVKDFLPVPQSQTQDGAIYTSPLGNASAIYGGEKIFSEKVIEASPFDRIQQQIKIGNDWSNKPVKYDYNTNIWEDYVRKYETSTTWIDGRTQTSVQLLQYFQASQLYKNTITDEDGNKTIEFKNGEGQLLLSRKVLNASENADTYYVYNEYDQLAFVIPPLASAPTVESVTVENLYYQYRYDGKGRLVEKKLPGKGWELMVYDKQDRVILTQDAVLGSTTNNFTKKGWLFTKYDQFGRVVYTGFFANSATRAAMQTAINNMTANPGNNESRSTTPFTLNGMDVYYTKNAFPTGSMTILSVKYYDTYPSLPIGVTAPSYIINTEQLVLKDIQGEKNTKDLLVASYVKNIEDDNWTKKYNWYDQKGRNIATYSINYLGGQTRTESLLDFAGVVKESHTFHKRTLNDSEVKIVEKFQYDHQNRLISHSHKVNNTQEEPLSINSYNEQGQLVNKKIGKDDDGNALQSIDYGYNIQGWMTSINDPSNLGYKIFGMKIKYQNPEDPTYGNPVYNGNISEVDWKTALGDGIYRRYDYKYDGLNRLTQGIYLTPDLASNTHNHFYDETLTYDLNGNIKTLNRFTNPPAGQNTPMQIDELVYEYEKQDSSNKLIKITDNRMNPSGYPAGGNIIGYDANGNMTNHLDKKIKNIKYNFLDLPTTVDAVVKGFTPSMNEGKLHSYKYRADGVKYAKRVDEISPYGQQFSETDYLDGFQYERQYSKMNTAQNSYDSGYILKFYPTSEGFYNFERGEYFYNLKDHLGNTRYSLKAGKGGGRHLIEETNYYPFGLKHEGYNGGSSLLGEYGINYNYKYNSKELQETGMYDYGARMYMPDLGRWGVIDPLAETSRRWNPYTYAYDNPIMFIDPDGREAKRCCSWNDVKAFGRGAWNATKGLVVGGIQSANPINGVLEGTVNVFKTYKAYQKGGLAGAGKQIGSIAAEVSGAKTIIHTGKGVLKGNPEAIGSATVMVAAVVVTHKVGGKVATTETGTASLEGSRLSRSQMSKVSGGGGAQRAAQYSSQWESASLSEAIQQFAPEAKGVTNAKGKTIYTNSESGIQVVYDNNGNYFRVENTNLSGKRNYLDMEGNIPNNKIEGGRTVGRSQSEYNQVTHFNNID